MALRFDYSSNPTKIFGLSTDTKPVKQDIGDLFYETDTFIWYEYSGDAGWIVFYPTFI